MLIIIGIAFAVLFFFVTYSGKHLSLSGAILLSAVITFFALFSLWNLLLLLMVSYGVLMVIDKLTRVKRAAIIGNIHKKSGKRTGVQVFANGFAAILSVVLYLTTKEKMFLIVYAVGVGETFADSIASDIGILSRRMPRDICTLKRIAPGLSGGVSMLGIIASVLVSVLFGLLAYFCIHLSMVEMLLIAALAMLGCIIDSLLGSLVQAKYQCIVCGVPTEKEQHCEATTQHVGGFRLIDNCTVNFISNSAVCGLCVLLLIYMK